MKEKAKYIHLFEELKRRQALSLLEQEDLIERRQGSGTYVRRVERRRERSWNVGVMATYISEYIFPSILRGIEGELSEEGFFPLLSATKNRVDNERRILEDYMEKRVDGLIVEGTKSALPNPNLHLYEKLKEMGIPVVFFNSYYPALQGCVSVTMDDRQGGIDAVEYLVARGHRRIGGIFKSDDMQGLARYEGYTRGLLRHGITLQDQWVTWFNSESYDTRQLGELASVGLTTFDHPKESLGACAARKLISMMSGREETSTVMDWGLAERNSV